MKEIFFGLIIKFSLKRGPSNLRGKELNSFFDERVDIKRFHQF